MQKKTSGISPCLLVLMQIGLILTLLVWWGLLGKFLLPAVIQGQADWGKAALLAVGLVILLPVGRWLLEETLREVQRSGAPQARQIEITRWRPSMPAGGTTPSSRWRRRRACRWC